VTPSRQVSFHCTDQVSSVTANASVTPVDHSVSSLRTQIYKGQTPFLVSFFTPLLPSPRSEGEVGTYRQFFSPPLLYSSLQGPSDPLCLWDKGV
jgi:hypothetical protein